MASVRSPEDDEGFDRRLTEALALFAGLGRRPHVWPSPAHSRPADLARLEADGFQPTARARDGARGPGGSPPFRGHRAWVGRDPARHPDRGGAGATDCESWRGPRGVVRGAAGSRGAAGGGPAAHPGRPRVLLVLVGWTAAGGLGEGDDFDGFTYLSSIGTRGAFRGRGSRGWRPATRWPSLASARRAAPTSASSRTTRPPCGVHAPGVRVLGESPDMMLG